MALVSWILCVHKHTPYLSHAINSCLTQTFTDFELLIVLNGESVDDLYQDLFPLLASDNRISIFTTPIRGLNFSLNLALNHVSSKYIARIDSDDISYPDRLDLQVSFMESHPDVMILGSAIDIINSNGALINSISFPLSNSSIRRSLLWTCPICHPSIIARTDFLRYNFGYLGNINCEDYDLWSRLSLNPNCIFANLRDKCIQYRSAGIGSARGSKMAYAGVAASQIRCFLLSFNPLWFFSFILTFLKLIFKSRVD